MNRFLQIFAAGAVVAGSLASCTYAGGDIGDPLTRKFHWFSYVAGDDLRKSCAASGPDRYRVVYNGVYGEQLRMYDLDAVRRLLVVHVTRPGNASTVVLSDPLAPWTADEARVQLDAATYERLVASFAAAGMFDPPPVGLEMESNGYFWTAAYCRQGQFGFTAWKYPSDAFSRLTFKGVLLPLDPTGVPVAEAGPVPFDPLRADERRKGAVGDFTLKVGRDGLVR